MFEGISQHRYVDEAFAPYTDWDPKASNWHDGNGTSAA